jgi:ParB-like chromosome segregation protein Spo0J
MFRGREGNEERKRLVRIGGEMKKSSTIADLKPDKRNARKHNPRNIDMIEKSLQEVGAARSIVIDEDNNILAGNGTVEAAAQAGITKLQVVDADGETIVAVRRTGLTKKQKARLALYDNKTAELAEWDMDVLAGMDGDFLVGIIPDFDVTEVDAPGLLDGDRDPFQQMTFTLHDEQAATVTSAIRKAIDRGCDSEVNKNSNGNALALICEDFLRG